MKRARGKSKGERHVRLRHWMLRSPAWRALSPNGKAVLLHVWERHNGVNNGQIVYAVREAAEIGVSRSAAGRALTEAIELGFLKVTRYSAFRVKTKEAREFTLTAEPIGDEPASKDFMRWTPPKFKTQSQKRVSQSLQRDTSSISYRYIGGEELVRRVTRGNGASFGDDARARRITRHYPKSEG